MDRNVTCNFCDYKVKQKQKFGEHLRAFHFDQCFHKAKWKLNIKAHFKLIITIFQSPI